MAVLLKQPLTNLTTLGNRSIAERLLVVRTRAELRFGLRYARTRDCPLHVLAGGSNVITAPVVDGLVALMRLRGRRLLEHGAHGELVLEAGENWHDTVRFSLGVGLRGLECLALIPGSVGAAPVQNIGAYGSELSQVLQWVEALDRETGAIERLSPKDCALGYRDSVFRRPEGERWIILRLALRLPRKAKPVTRGELYPDLERELDRMGLCRPTPSQLAEAVIRVRRRKLPAWRQLGNVGSVFKNPVVSARRYDQLRSHFPQLKAVDLGSRRRLAAAQLIDLAGLKGLRIGRAQPWFKQPLVLTLRDRGQSNGSDFIALIQVVQQRIRDTFAIDLTVEPRLLGFQPPP